MSASAKDDHNSAPDDVRKKFKEALDRKNQRHEEHQVAGPEEHNDAHTGPARVQRQFRRKSG